MTDSDMNVEKMKSETERLKQRNEDTAKMHASRKLEADEERATKEKIDHDRGAEVKASKKLRVACRSVNGAIIPFGESARLLDELEEISIADAAEFASLLLIAEKLNLSISAILGKMHKRLDVLDPTYAMSRIAARTGLYL